MASEKDPLICCYKEMYRCMIAKDTDGLAQMLDDSFVLTHMTGMRQPKETFLRAVKDGTLNYYAAQDERIEVNIEGAHATLLGQSQVTAAVFGGSRGNWRLQLHIEFRKSDGSWRMTSACASTY